MNKVLSRLAGLIWNGSCSTLSRLTNFPEKNPNPVFEMNGYGEIPYANDAARRVFPDLLEQRGDHPLAVGLVHILEENLRDITAMQREVVFKNKTYEENIVFIPSCGSINVYAIDITEKKKLEAQFLQAQKMEGMGQLAGGIAHDFTNILAVILGYCEFISKKLQNDTSLAPQLAEIKKAAEQGMLLTGQLLTFARKKTEQARILNLADVILNTKGMLQRLAGRRTELDLKIQTDDGAVFICPGHVEQLLMNLCTNARDAMESVEERRDSVPRLLIELKNIHFADAVPLAEGNLEPGDYVMLSVEDNGKGMTEEVRTRIFEPFFTTKGEGKGTGLGLATVYGIVKQNKGVVTVVSEPGRGTTFRIYLPRFKGPEIAKEGVIPAALSVNSQNLKAIG